MPRATPRSTLVRYTLYQIPEWVLVLGAAILLYRRGMLPGWAGALLVAGCMAKDAALYPLLRTAYETDTSSAIERLIGLRGVAVEPLAPRRLRARPRRAVALGGDGRRSGDPTRASRHRCTRYGARRCSSAPRRREPPDSGPWRKSPLPSSGDASRRTAWFGGCPCPNRHDRGRRSPRRRETSGPVSYARRAPQWTISRILYPTAPRGRDDAGRRPFLYPRHHWRGRATYPEASDGPP